MKPNRCAGSSKYSRLGFQAQYSPRTVLCNDQRNYSCVPISFAISLFGANILLLPPPPFGRYSSTTLPYLAIFGIWVTSTRYRQDSFPLISMISSDYRISQGASDSLFQCLAKRQINKDRQCTVPSVHHGPSSGAVTTPWNYIPGSCQLVDQHGGEERNENKYFIPRTLYIDHHSFRQTAPHLYHDLRWHSEQQCMR